MKSLKIIVIILIGLFTTSPLWAQPFSLDKELKPILLSLKEDAQNPKTKNIITNGFIDEKDAFYYVKGHDVFEYLDIYVFSNYGNPDLKVELVNTNWTDVVETQNTNDSEDGIIHFKIRAYSDFGLHLFPGDEKINFTIAVSASEPVTEYLGSAFRKARTGELDTSESTTSAAHENNSQTDATSSTPIWLYIVLGAAALIIALLLGVILGRKKAALFWLFFLFITTPSFAQQDNGMTWHDTNRYGEWLQEQANDNRGGFWENANQVRQGLGRLGKFGEKFGKYKKTFDAANNAYKAYTNLNGCINSVPPAGMPRIPSFCETDDCESCFLDARTRFNKNRYTFEKLKVIYGCTRNFTDAAISFGDNVSGYHGVSGLAWQSQKGGINKSINDLKQAYDKKYAELLESQHEILQELNRCEAEHGIPDWYDRFGYLYFEFTKMNYQRKI